MRHAYLAFMLAGDGGGKSNETHAGRERQMGFQAFTVVRPSPIARSSPPQCTASSAQPPTHE
jgi:hypothetical protein